MKRTSPTSRQSRRGATGAALLLATIVTATPITVSAAPTTIWVNDNAPNGYAAPGTSCNSAGYATIRAAVNAASAGDTVSVCPGTYIENVTINKANLTVMSTGEQHHHSGLGN